MAVSDANRKRAPLGIKIFLWLQTIQAPPKAPGSTGNYKISILKH